MSSLVLATRRSALALAQARAWVGTLIQAHPGLSVEELHITTTGDRIQDRSLAEIGGKGLFIKEIEEALLDGRAQVAVHSAKDLPADVAPGLALICFPHREDPRDVIITREGCLLSELPPGSRIGTSSLRRRVQIAAMRPDLEIVPLRGNVDTRLRRCTEGTVDAIVLARAGLARLGLLDRVTQTLEPDQCLPAVGQGALAIEQRAGDNATSALLRPLNHADTAFAVAAERGVMRAVEGSCQLPLAALAQRQGQELWLRALLAEPDGSRLRRTELRAPWPETWAAAETLGLQAGAELRTG